LFIAAFFGGQIAVYAEAQEPKNVSLGALAREFGISRETLYQYAPITKS
jgi:predicted transcriptional regulator